MPATKQKAEVKRLFDTGAHFGQVKSRRHASMKPYLIGTKGKQEIIDLSQTADQLEAAKNALELMAKEGKTVLLVGGKTEIASLVRQTAKQLGLPYVSTRWLGGTISNWNEIKKRVDRLAELNEKMATGALAKEHTKLELVRLERERVRLEEHLDGLTTLTKRPDMLLVVDTRHEKHAVKEAKDARIPVVAIMNSDCNVKDATYPIVANDSSRETVRLMLEDLASAFEKGRAK